MDEGGGDGRREERNAQGEEETAGVERFPIEKARGPSDSLSRSSGGVKYLAGRLQGTVPDNIHSLQDVREARKRSNAPLGGANLRLAKEAHLAHAKGMRTWGLEEKTGNFLTRHASEVRVGIIGARNTTDRKLWIVGRQSDSTDGAVLRTAVLLGGLFPQGQSPLEQDAVLSVLRHWLEEYFGREPVRPILRKSPSLRREGIFIEWPPEA